jgi:alkyl hydroperoxide reductase subunit AhpF
MKTMSGANGTHNGNQNGALGDGGAAEAVENVIVIGSGPAGFTAGLYAARANLSPLLITGNDYGGQVSITYDVENYPGFPVSVSGPELVEKMKEQAEKFGTRIEFDYVTELVTDQFPFAVHTTSGKAYKARSIIVATGAHPRYLDIPGEKERCELLRHLRRLFLPGQGCVGGRRRRQRCRRGAFPDPLCQPGADFAPA